MVLKDLKQLEKVGIEGINPTQLVHLEEVGIDISLPARRRMECYLDEIKNPYCFLCGKTPVKICFMPEGGELRSKIKAYFLSFKQ